MNGLEVLFACVGVVALGSAVLVVTSHNLVHAALWLVVTFGALAGCFLLLTAEFVAWVQVLIYVGAIVVLLLFGLMLTRAPIGYSSDLDSGNRPAAALVAAGTAATLVAAVVDAFGRAFVDLDGAGGAGAAAPGSGEAIGTAVFRYWVLPFEVLSLLLLASLVGAIALSRARERTRG
ncbi:MAG: NADH-quinone oxidoreductase subunit J family protein [Carbonactinosporaceae bacterium]